MKRYSYVLFLHTHKKEKSTFTFVEFSDLHQSLKMGKEGLLCKSDGQAAYIIRFRCMYQGFDLLFWQIISLILNKKVQSSPGIEMLNMKP